jgi:MerR family transcriptional regulator, heat shock protein HspR
MTLSGFYRFRHTDLVPPWHLRSIQRQQAINVRDAYGRDPGRPVYVISVAAGIVRVHPRTLRIYEEEGLVCPARTPSNIRLYSEDDIRRVLWIRHLTQNLGVNLAGVRILFEIEKRMGTRILETLFADPGSSREDAPADVDATPDRPIEPVATPSRRA